MPFVGVPELLAALSGAPLMVATNKPGGFSGTILAGLALDGFFRRVVGGDQTPARKPDPAHLRACLAGLDVAPGEVVVVGDSPNDILAARALGAVSVGCTWGLVPAGELARRQARPSDRRAARAGGARSAHRPDGRHREQP